MIALAVAAQDRERVVRFGHEYLLGLIWPQFAVLIDMSRRTGLIDAPGVHAEYIDLAGEAELDLLHAVRPMDYDTWQGIQELEGRGLASDGTSSVIESRGMRDRSDHL